MRKVKVPIDMASEQKEILGLFSKRQLAYVVIGGIILYSYVPVVYNLFSIFGWEVGALAGLFSAAPLAGLILFLGFTKVRKFNMNRDYYFYIRLQRKTQYGSWRKGS